MILIWMSDLEALLRAARYVGFDLIAKVRQTCMRQLLVSSTVLCRFPNLFLFFVDII
jgi:hypothetical protein